MFTGLIEELGEIAGVADGPDGRRLRVRAARLGRSLSPGASIAVNGVCQTVVNLAGPSEFEVLAVGETLRRTTFAGYRTGRPVNLERPLRVGDRLDGHWVNGHVDGTGRILEIQRQGRDFSFRISLPAGIQPFVVEKGSIAVDGVSLTLGEVGPDSFRVYIIPETRERTLFGTYRAGDEVNVEADILAKYAARAAAMAAPARGVPGGEPPRGDRSIWSSGPGTGWASDDGGAPGADWGPRARGVLESWERGDR